MEGVIVLNSWMEQISGGPKPIIGLICCAGLTIICILGAIFGFKEKEPSGLACIFFALLFASLGYLSIQKIPVEYEERQTVLIQDSVSFNDFTEKYELLEQEGLTYTVRFKEDNE